MKNSIRTFMVFALYVFFAVLLVACGSYSGSGQSAATDDTTISVDGKNNAPVADAGPDQAVQTGSTIVLDGSGSYDPDNDPITYLWAFVSIPSGSTATLSDPTAVSPSFVADLEGTYEVSLLVSDGSKDDTDTVLINAVQSAPVTDTGQNVDWSPVFGEDSDYSINAPSLADNGDGTVSDLVLGLMWQQESPGENTWDNTVAYCDGLTLGGHDDWRVPSTQESISLITYLNPNQHFILDETAFPADSQWLIDWWTSQTYVNSPKKTSYAFVINGWGVLHKADKTASSGIRCVRGEQYRTVQALADNGDGTVSDLGSALVWQQDDSVQGLSNYEPLTYCEDMVLAGLDDWRLPNVKELASIIDHTTASPAANTTVFPAMQSSYYCTTTNNQQFVGSTGHLHRVRFTDGEIVDGSGPTCIAKCVRGGN